VINLTLSQFLAKHLPKATVWIAYSGGIDSHVLLHAMVHLQKDNPLPFQLKAVHINHGISPYAQDWTRHCEAVCQQLTISLETYSIKLDKLKKNLEAEARKARYSTFKTLLKEGDYLLTAHHLDDQAETLLLHLFRGAGVKGLAAMPEVKPFAHGFLARPILSITRTEIFDYATTHQLQWINDESNSDTTFSRNLLREKVIPLLQTRWPQVNQGIVKTAGLMRTEQQLLDEVAEEDLHKVLSTNLSSLSVSLLQMLSRVRLQNLLRYWVAKQGFLMPSKQKLDILINEVILAAKDAKACIHWDNVEIRKWRDTLSLSVKTEEPKTDVVILWEDLNKKIKLPGDLGYLFAKKSAETGVLIQSGDKVEVRFRQAGERCKLPGYAGHKTLKKLMQEWSIPYWQRNQIPLVYINDQLAVIVGYAICEGFCIEKTGYFIQLSQ